MNIDILRKLGMNNTEIRVYIALLEIGQTTTGALVKKAGVHSSKIYNILSSLVEKGIVGYIVEGGVKKFRANNPIVLSHLLDLKEQEMQKIKIELKQTLPDFEKMFSEEKADYGIEILEGLRGIKTVYDFTLGHCKKGEMLYTVGYPLLASQLLNAYFKDYHKKIAKKGLKAKILYDYDTWFFKIREPRLHAEQRYLPKSIKTPAFIHIFKGHIGIMVVTEKQKLCIFIKNKEVADSYIHYFNLLWQLGKEP